MVAKLRKYPEFSAPGLAEKLSKDAAVLVQVVRGMPEGPQKMHLKEAFTGSLRFVWIVCCVLLAVGGLLSVFTASYDLNQGIDSEQTLVEKKDRNSTVETGVTPSQKA